MAELGYTQGTGAEIRTDQGTSGAHMQVVKLAEGTVGSENLIPGTVGQGLLVHVSAIDGAVEISGTPQVIIEQMPTVTVAAVNGTVAVTGSVSITGTPAVSISGTPAVSVTGAVAAKISDAGGVAFSPANPLPTQNQPSAAASIWKAHVTFGASQADQTIYAPPAGKTAYLEGITITPTAVGVLAIYDQTNADTDMIYKGQPPVGVTVISPSRPIPLSAANNILRYATGTAAGGDITAWGYFQ